MDKKTEQINLRISKRELGVIKKLADIQGVTQTALIMGMIRRSAKRKKIWDYERP